ncbi:1-phosphatidylinositol-4-phosphate 5-kinase Its3 [Schizosaccharomyces japonicus yFS275]|uniref:1-phosphatidylinositol-4-phosphate 5-kinase n=1 Tax=Schizosaccharomyces japonicus (strain yFS275 / FY16936) TaxID=402676 RepID=B6JZ39_SCHJY|nr:1-phosphatidylinositol-4-phosphate 5-kinase Its3 [Schizosaccharomyces japonicus yFS275]EEB06807.1 1-phosphatidylinositol-4-phosphate 5-kinase Its3 [Schizosaccharomyces japonicus yFS275]
MEKEITSLNESHSYNDRNETENRESQQGGSSTSTAPIDFQPRQRRTTLRAARRVNNGGIDGSSVNSRATLGINGHHSTLRLQTTGLTNGTSTDPISPIQIGTVESSPNGLSDRHPATRSTYDLDQMCSPSTSMSNTSANDFYESPTHSTSLLVSQDGEAPGTRAGDTMDSARHSIPPDIDSARWAEAVKQRRLNQRKRLEELDDDCVLVGTRVSEGHENYVTAYNMLTGIRVGVSRCQAKVDRELVASDFTAKHKFTFDITGNELTPSAKYDFKFKDYAPWVFRHLRQLFHLDAADYLVSLTSKYILSELGSPGKSGSFFYFSRDYRFIIKTIHHSEHKFLRDILRDYYNHVKNNPNTLISQFYGLHRVKLPFGRKIHFVVMNNLFPPHRDIHQMFDLKGSTLGRELDEELAKKNPSATMKDTNWINRNMHLQFGPLKRQLLLAQMKADVDLLSSLGIMDYSMLIGIHDLNRGNRDNIRDSILSVYEPDMSHHALIAGPQTQSTAHEMRRAVNTTGPVSLDRSCYRLPDDQFMERRHFLFYCDDGGFRATDENNQPGNFIFYIGIIDLLTKYNYVKRVEHFWKGLSHPRSDISSVPPPEYAERFLGFIANSINPSPLLLRATPIKRTEPVLGLTPEGDEEQDPPPSQPTVGALNNSSLQLPSSPRNPITDDTESLEMPAYSYHGSAARLAS